MHTRRRESRTGAPALGRQWWGLTATLLAVFMGNVDIFIVQVAAPVLQTDLHTSFAAVQLVVSGYVVAYAAGLVTGGRCGDRWGRKRVFLLGLAGFTLASAGCAAAPTSGFLIVARLAQGACAAVMLPQVLALIHAEFTEPARGRALSAYGASLGLGSVAGLLLGGLLLATNPAGLGWRVIFLINIPAGLVALALAFPTVSESRGQRSVDLDVIGTGLLGLALAGVLDPILQGHERGWPAWTLPTLAAGLAVLTGFVAWQHRQQHAGRVPLLPLWLFADSGFRTGLVTILAFYSANAGLYFTLTYYLQAGLGQGPLGAGLTFLPLGVGFALSSLVSGRLVHRHGPRVLPLGALIMLVGAGLAASAVGLLPASAGPMVPALGVYGIGGGLEAAPLLGHSLRTIGAAETGAASGALLTGQQTANALGIATLGTVYDTVATPNLTLDASRHAFLTALALIAALVATTTALLYSTGRTPSRNSSDQAQR